MLKRGEDSFILFLVLIVLALIIAWVTLVTNSPIINVFVGFSPTILTIIMVFMVMEEIEQPHLSFQVAIALGFSVIFFVTGTFLNIFSGIDVASLAVTNFFASIIFIMLINMPRHIKRSRPKTIKQEKKPIKHYVQSIEDKSKAINEVIGRVYSTHHGGNEGIRKKIKIDNEWYNELTETNEISKIKDAILKIKLRLLELQKTESEVFGNETRSLMKLQRAPNGADKIIDVLAKNDKDPILVYYKSALDYCEEALKNLGI